MAVSLPCTALHVLCVVRAIKYMIYSKAVEFCEGLVLSISSFLSFSFSFSFFFFFKKKVFVVVIYT
jgi:hypothetical protein